MSLLALDARWRRFNDENRSCPCCGQQFSGVFDLGYDHPDVWPHDSLAKSGQDDFQIGTDRLTPDLCRCGEDRFVRCVLPIPIRGSDDIFFFGPWASVHPDVFYAYIEEAAGDPTGQSTVFRGGLAWLMNDLPGFNSEAQIACELRPGDTGQRPQLFAQKGTLADAQTNGISFDQLLDIYAASGTDVRPHLNTN